MSGSGTVETLAPAKLNLCLYVGPLTDEGLHSMVSIFQPIDLCDRLLISEADSDEVVCLEVEGEDLAARALRLVREAGLDLPPLRIEIEKRIPLAAGMGGGSADAAAVLRHARGVIGEDSVPALERVALAIGSDVLAQSGLWAESPDGAEALRAIVCGTGDEVSAAPAGDGFVAVVLTSDQGLSTPEVYAEADRIGSERTEPELAGVAESLRFGSSGLPLFPAEAMVNDLQAAAISLRPELEEKLVALREAGAVNALVTGSGPTVYGVFATRVDAERAAGELSGKGMTGIVVAEPLGAPSIEGAGQ